MTVGIPAMAAPPRDSCPLGGGIHSALRSVLILIALAICTAAPQAQTQGESDAPVLERRIKAAFLYKFAGYVEWPEGSFPRAESPINIAVLGADSVAAELGEITVGRTVNGRPLAIRVVKDGEPIPAGVHILFIGRTHGARIGAIVRTIQQRGILIVTESESALSQGSMINFVLSEGRVKFEISMVSAEKSGLSLSSRLLTVAVAVRRTP